RVKWTGEQMDVFAIEVRRLAGLAGFIGAALEKIVKLTFVNGFPEHISVALQQIPDIGTISMSTLIPKARILATKQVPEVAIVAVRGAGIVRPTGTGSGSGSSLSFRGK
ncbi:hypothetical protein SK128_000620, partial [Halocaridina rubra]